MYRVQVNGTDYVAPNLSTLQQWATEGRLLPETMVWVEQEQNHRPASQIPGLQFAMSRQGFETPPSYGAASYPRGSFGPQPPNHLVWAILSTVLCCLPLGVVSLVFAAQVDSFYARGEYQKAIDASNKAKTWAIVSAVSSFVLTIVWIGFMVVMGGFN